MPLQTQSGSSIRRLTSKFKKSIQEIVSNLAESMALGQGETLVQVSDLDTMPERVHGQKSPLEVDSAMLLDDIEENITILTDKETKNELTYDFEQSHDAIVEQSRHIVRSVQQNTGKANDIKNLSDDCACMTVDWAQKILRTEHREGQSKYFGKKGMSVLVESFTMNNPEIADSYKTETYMLALTRCRQNELDTLSGGHLIAAEFAKRHPTNQETVKKIRQCECSW
ncbi:unnamed protein product [Didymodactylos carnosus]|uniref:Uncharacterized protein n=2 Tax=Didymodactylos carnosus TaxID=1234261 RepID=A0A815RY66_9BILA|nr:unnamed protein product [Didymodactylos carnosus]CAF4348615.1 unnamed protein product [Didymodactylos carnosus]